MAAVREAMDEDIVRHALGVALAELRKRIDEAMPPEEIHRVIADIDTRLIRTLKMGQEIGMVPPVQAELDRLKLERAEAVRIEREAMAEVPTVEDLMPIFGEKIEHIEETLRADLASGRLVLGALLGDERLRVYADGRIEGVAVLEPETLAAPKRTSEPRDSVVAGARSDRLHTEGIPLAVRIQFSS